MSTYGITKASYSQQGNLEEATGYAIVANKIGDELEFSRNELISLVRQGHNVRTLSINEKYSWYYTGWVGIYEVGIGYSFLTINGAPGTRDSLGDIPEVIPKRKLFISYYHKDDNIWKSRFQIAFGDLFVNKSVKDGDINSGNNDEYIKHLIQDGYLDDTTVLLVLVSAKTRCRKHVDWEISGALNRKVGERYAGLWALHVPTHSEYGVKTYVPALQPARLADNAATRYAGIYDWTLNRTWTQRRIEAAFNAREDKEDCRRNDRLQLTEDLCD